MFSSGSGSKLECKCWNVVLVWVLRDGENGGVSKEGERGEHEDVGVGRRDGRERLGVQFNFRGENLLREPGLVCMGKPKLC